MSVVFKSVLNPDKRGYELVTGYDSDRWTRRGQAACLSELMTFDTYGDGLTKHSGSWCVQFAEFTDAAVSLATAIFADPANEDWRRGLMMLGEMPADDAIAFAAALKWKEGRRQWYCYESRKVTTSESKQYDKRWTEVPQWADGTAGAVFRVLAGDPVRDWFWRMMAAKTIREWFGARGDWAPWENVFQPAKDLAGDWDAALNALIHAVAVVNALHYGKSALECAVHNSRPEPAAEVAA